MNISKYQTVLMIPKLKLFVNLNCSLCDRKRACAVQCWEWVNVPIIFMQESFNAVPRSSFFKALLFICQPIMQLYSNHLSVPFLIFQLVIRHSTVVSSSVCTMILCWGVVVYRGCILLVIFCLVPAINNCSYNLKTHFVQGTSFELSY